MLIDETKLKEVKEIIDTADSLMGEKDCENDEQARKELLSLQDRLRELTGKYNLDIRDFRQYWECTDLDVIARSALNPVPQKEQITDERIREIVKGILNHSESDMDYWLEYLQVNTGLDDLTDYIFYPDLVGLDSNASLDEIAEKIIVDSKKDKKVIL